jgi:hypothetical protein
VSKRFTDVYSSPNRLFFRGRTSEEIINKRHGFRLLAIFSAQYRFNPHNAAATRQNNFAAGELWLIIFFNSPCQSYAQ